MFNVLKKFMFLKFTSMNTIKTWMTALLFFAVAGTTATAQTAEQFSVSTLNVDGLPKRILVFKVNADGPGDDGSARIGKYFQKKGYDLVFMQEDFNYHRVITVLMEDDYKFDTWTGDVDVVDHSIDFLHLQNHRFECDGLMGCWKNDLTVTPGSPVAWTQNFGKFSHAMDEMVTKGYRRYEVTLRGGSRIVVYNMHMDASDDADVDDGLDTEDKNARMAQWTQLKDDIMSRLDNRPVIIVGDVNSLYKRDNVKGQFIDAIRSTGRATVSDVFIELQKNNVYPTYTPDIKLKDEDLEVLAGETLDKILYINPVNGSKLRPISFAVDQEGYQYDGKPLGDHYPLSVVFQIDPSSAAIAEAESEGVNDSSPSSFWNMNGQQVTRPSTGLYIERQGDKTSKRIIK